MSHTTPTDSKRPITQLNLRQLNGSAEYYYHQYRLAEENLHDEIKSVVAGQRATTRGVRRLQKIRDEAYDTHMQFAEEICRRIRLRDGITETDADTGETIIDMLRRRQIARDRAAVKRRLNPAPNRQN